MTDPNSNGWTYAYDSFGERTSLTAPPTAENPSGNKTLYGYDTSRGWLTSQVSPRGTAAGITTSCTPPALGCTTYGHDAFGEVTSVTDPLGHVTATTYDPDHHRTSTTDATANKTSYSYDPAAQQTTVNQADGTGLRRMVKGMDRPYHPWGLAGSWLADPASWGIDPEASPSLQVVLKLRRERMDEVRQAIGAVTTAELERVCVPPDSPGHPTRDHTVRECIHVILNEEWEHNCYAKRDLDILDTR